MEYELDFNTGQLIPKPLNKSAWARTFVIMPVNTIGGERVWFKHVYFRDIVYLGTPTISWTDIKRRAIKTEWNPYTVREYATYFDILKEQHGA